MTGCRWTMNRKTRGRKRLWRKVRDYAVLCPEGPIKTTKHSYRTLSILTEIRTRHLPKIIHKLFGPTCSERIWNAQSSSLLTGMSWYKPEYILKLRRQRRYPHGQQHSQKPKADRCTSPGYAIANVLATSADRCAILCLQLAQPQ